eukprot:CAMPEP_0172641862 /NCGR_PEP_ID=MMETSP1068-20121228/229443_1 /TAXON_ID=35684 /ORGANISM="Pseudopedinella elastica, Strain CCMP716" /LENGTH=307 /DNA_ID=CAMNT_0013455557 /DNA_START=773 /DNA_END=1696 /DNA_ORIENTATION=-
MLEGSQLLATITLVILIEGKRKTTSNMRQHSSLHEVQYSRVARAVCAVIPILLTIGFDVSSGIVMNVGYNIGYGLIGSQFFITAALAVIAVGNAMVGLRYLFQAREVAIPLYSYLKLRVTLNIAQQTAGVDVRAVQRLLMLLAMNGGFMVASSVVKLALLVDVAAGLPSPEKFLGTIAAWILTRVCVSYWHVSAVAPGLVAPCLMNAGYRRLRRQGVVHPDEEAAADFGPRAGPRAGPRGAHDEIAVRSEIRSYDDIATALTAFEEIKREATTGEAKRGSSVEDHEAVPSEGEAPQNSSRLASEKVP